MVHALLEAHRVLTSKGLLIDLRPAAVHRRVGFTEAGGYRLPWVMRENFDDDRAADRAVKEVVREGRFRPERRVQFDCYRTMDSLGEFQDWLTDFVNKGKFGPHDWLVRRLERDLAFTRTKAKIVVCGPLVLRVLKKQDPVS